MPGPFFARNPLGVCAPSVSRVVGGEVLSLTISDPLPSRLGAPWNPSLAQSPASHQSPSFAGCQPERSELAEGGNTVLWSRRKADPRLLICMPRPDWLATGPSSSSSPDTIVGGGAHIGPSPILSSSVPCSRWELLLAVL